MKRLGCVGLSAVLSILTLAGCGQSDLKADTNTVYVEKNGAVLSMDVEAFDQEYYDEAELKEFVDSEVADYNGQHGEKSVEVKDLSVEDGTAKLKLAYRTVDDYTAFTGVELYQGKVVQAMAAGYDFDVDFAAVDEDGVHGVLGSEITDQGDLKVVIIKANTNVQVDGKILYVSCDNVTLTGKNSVSIQTGTGIEKTWKTESEQVPATEAMEGTESEDDFVIEGEVVVSTEEPESVVTDIKGDPSETDVYTYILYK